MPANNPDTPLQRFHQADPMSTSLKKGDFTLTNGTASERTKVADFQVPYPIAFRENHPIRMALVYHEGFYHNGTGTAEQTHNLAYDVVETVNTDPILAYADSTQLTQVASSPGTGEFSVDYAANSITVDQNTDVTVHVFYVARDPLKVEVWKEQPGTRGSLGALVYDDITADLHVRDQNQEPPEFSFNSEYEPMVPEDWTVSIYADDTSGSAFGIDWDDSDTDTTGSKTVAGVSAVNAVIDLPIYQAQSSVPGLERMVVDDISNSLSPR